MSKGRRPNNRFNRERNLTINFNRAINELDIMGASSMDSEETYAEVLQRKYFHEHFTTLCRMYISSHEWGGKSIEHIPVDIIETVLLEEGGCVFVKDKLQNGDYVFELDLNVYRPLAINTYGVNMYGVPKGDINIRNVYGPHMEPKSVDLKEDAIYLKSTIGNLEQGGMIDLNYIHLVSTEIANMRVTKHINLMQQRQTHLITVNEETNKRDANTIMQKQLSGSIYQVVVKGLNAQKMEKMDFNTPLLGMDLDILIKNAWSEALTRLGIENVNVNKRERLNTAEAEGNNHEVDLNGDIRLKLRQQVCDEIKKRWPGTDIWVKRRELIETDLTYRGKESLEEVEVDGYSE